jgi:TonB family protein
MRTLIPALVLLSGLFALCPQAMAGDRTATKRVAPVYPALAKRMKVAGTVKLEVKIAASGKVQEVKVLSGHPLLGPAAKECVSQWQFAPADTDSTELIELEFKM